MSQIIILDEIAHHGHGGILKIGQVRTCKLEYRRSRSHEVYVEACRQMATILSICLFIHVVMLFDHVGVYVCALAYAHI